MNDKKKHYKIQRFKEETEPLLKISLDQNLIKFFTAKELLEITEESPEEFLAREISGYWKPQEYCNQVIKNFLDNDIYYLEKYLRISRQ